jgi:hypothetical protein
MILGNNTEIIGRLTKIKQENNQNILVFSFLKEIEIPIEAISKKKLDTLVGERIGILHCQDHYKIRKIRQK